MVVATYRQESVASGNHWFGIVPGRLAPGQRGGLSGCGEVLLASSWAVARAMARVMTHDRPNGATHRGRCSCESGSAITLRHVSRLRGRSMPTIRAPLRGDRRRAARRAEGRIVEQRDPVRRDRRHLGVRAHPPLAPAGLLRSGCRVRAAGRGRRHGDGRRGRQASFRARPRCCCFGPRRRCCLRLRRRCCLRLRRRCLGPGCRRWLWLWLRGCRCSRSCCRFCFRLRPRRHCCFGPRPWCFWFSPRCWLRFPARCWLRFRRGTSTRASSRSGRSTPGPRRRTGRRP